MGAAGSKLEKALGNQFPEGERYFGLENFGNTCYCNSVLQRSGCLGSTLAVMKKSSKLLPKVQSQNEEMKNFGRCNKAIEKESSHSGESDEE